MSERRLFDINAAMTPVEAAQRLRQLRENLHLSQRDLAREFQVTPGAIAMWEKGSRPVPGPVQKLIEIYEHYSPAAPAPLPEREIRRVSADWTTRILRVVAPRGRRNPALQDGIQNQLSSLLKTELAGEGWKRSLQMSLIERVVDSLGESKGLPMKMAQLVSYADLSLPQDVRDTLATLQTMSAPMSAGVAARVFHEEIGKPPHKVFAEWESRPFAAASIGQVHRARLHSGERVAVKIQYPDVYDALLTDFNRIELFQKLTSIFRGRDQVGFDEIKSQLLAECDYAREARNQEWFAGYFDGHPRVRVPKIYPEFSRARVLTQEYVEGVHLQDFLKNSTPPQRQDAAKGLADFFSQCFFLTGRLHADAHPGNVLFDGKRAVILDFGRVVELSDQERRNYRDIWLATVRDDKAEGREVFRRFDVVKDWDRFDFDDFWNLNRTVHTHDGQDAEFTMTPDYARACYQRMKTFPQARQIRSTPGFLWSNTVHLGTWHMLAELRAQANWQRWTHEIIGHMPENGTRARWAETEFSRG